ncbi:MAG: ABC transporter ATP-binding protein, partial [Saprospiraceae bacterium]|nr:ABC transporter ATP-binding protein [Saprospiraceae bacterium]
MRSFWRLLKYIENYKLLVGLNIGSNILTAIFTAISIPLLIPFLEILFERTQLVTERPELSLDIESITAFFYYHLSTLIIENGRETALLYVVGILLTIFFFKNLFRYLSLFFMAPVRNGIIRDVRRQLFDKVLVLPLAYFSEERKGDIMSRVIADVQEVEWSILNFLEATFREPLIILGSLLFMLYVSPSLTAFVFVLILLTGLIIGWIGRSLKRSSGQVQHLLGNLVSIIEEALGGLRIIKGFNAEGYQQEKFARENNAYRRLLTRLLWRKDLSSPMSEFLGIAVVSVLLWYGSRLVFSGDIQAETFFTFIFAFYNVIEPAKSFSKATYNIQKGIAAMNRVERILDAENTITDRSGALSVSQFNDSIVYDNVGFTYRSEEGPVLRHINLEVKKGSIVALVGASGAGKSTLVDLLPRFYDVEEGRIL